MYFIYLKNVQDIEIIENISNFNNYDPKQENYLKLSWDLFEKFETDINFDLTNLEDQPKYYQILKEDTHRDSRFSFRSINPAERIQTLRGILKNWVEFNQDIGIVTWINHGPLLGWYWNKQLFPWDADLDFQISPHHYEILKKYNQTIINENYLVDLNPYYLDRRAWGFNVIDGRFICMKTGLYIDLTILVKTPNRSSFLRDKYGLACKSPHTYQYDELFPLRISTLEGVEIYLPNKYHSILLNEYGEKGVNNPKFYYKKTGKTYVFDKNEMQWVEQQEN